MWDDDMVRFRDFELRRDGNDGGAKGGVRDERATVAAEEIDAEI